MPSDTGLIIGEEQAQVWDCRKGKTQAMGNGNRPNKAMKSG
jgi:hypothetical protein